MRPSKTSSVRRVAFLIVPAAIIFTFHSTLFAQSGSPSIISPVSNTIVAPGTNLMVIVQAPSNSSFSSVGLVLRDPAGSGWTQAITRPPYQFVVPIARSDLGLKQITAFGLTGPGQGVFSEPVSIDVESNLAVQSLSVSPAAIAFDYVGGKMPITAMATYSDQTSADVTRSSRVAYLSADTSVATVDGTGNISAIGGGSTTVSVLYGNQQQTVTITVPKTVRGDLNGDSNIDKDDLDILTSMSWTANSVEKIQKILSVDGDITSLVLPLLQEQTSDEDDADDARILDYSVGKFFPGEDSVQVVCRVDFSGRGIARYLFVIYKDGKSLRGQMIEIGYEIGRLSSVVKDLNHNGYKELLVSADAIPDESQNSLAYVTHIEQLSRNGVKEVDANYAGYYRDVSIPSLRDRVSKLQSQLALSPVGSAKYTRLSRKLAAMKNGMERETEFLQTLGN